MCQNSQSKIILVEESNEAFNASQTIAQLVFFISYALNLFSSALSDAYFINDVLC